MQARMTVPFFLNNVSLGKFFGSHFILFPLFPFIFPFFIFLLSISVSFIFYGYM